MNSWGFSPLRHERTLGVLLSAMTYMRSVPPPSLKLGEAVRQGPFVCVVWRGALGGRLAFRARSMGCKASREAAGPAPTIDFTAGPVDWGAPGEARHTWKGKFFTA